MESNGDPLPIFNIERVQLQFSIASNFVAAQVADNVLILALSTGRLLRIDLDNPADIDGQWSCRFVNPRSTKPALCANKANLISRC